MSNTLWGLKAQQTCTINGYAKSLDESYKVRLMDLGFHPGELVECVQSPSLGAPKLFKINNAVFALDDQVAKEVICE